MINYLKDIKKETLIGQLPDVINNNNESIRKEFNWIFDSSLNRLTKSVYAPTGSVKSHFGEFTNLACEYFTIKNIDSIKASIQDSVESIINETLNVSSMQTVMAALTNIANSSFIDPSAYDISALCDISTLIVNHNVLNNRFKNADFIDDIQQDFCHDAAAIIYKKDKNNRYVTVEQALDSVNAYDIDKIMEEVQQCNTSINNLNESIEYCNASIGNIKQVNQQQNIVIQNLNVSTQQQDTSIKRLFAQNNILNTELNRISGSLDRISDYVDIINANNILQETNFEYKIYPNHCNIMTNIIESDETEITIALAGEEDIIENNIIKQQKFEYNFKLFLSENVSIIYLSFEPIWYEFVNTLRETYHDDLYVNIISNDNIKISFNENNEKIMVSRENRIPSIFEFTINKIHLDSPNSHTGGICMITCKTYDII